MKTLSILISIIALVILIPMQACAQTHTVNLSWQASPETGATYNIYRAPGACPSSGQPAGAVKIASGLTKLTDTDSTVQVESYCYYATATVNGLESYPSNDAQADVKPFGPTTLSITSIH